MKVALLLTMLRSRVQMGNQYVKIFMYRYIIIVGEYRKKKCLRLFFFGFLLYVVYVL